MDESALRALIANLDASGSLLHWWLNVSTFFVVVGVVLELVFVVVEYREELHQFKRGVIRPPDRPSRLLFVSGLLGAVLVALGVSGELYAGAKIEQLETRIRKANDDLYLILSKEAGDAATFAKTAHEEADAVKGIADEARADAKDALAKAQAAQRELAHAEADAAKAQTLASKALSTANKAESHLADTMKRANALTAQLDRLTTPRSLPHSPQVIASLKPFKDTEYMFIEVCSDTECVNLLRDIDSVLGLAGWKRVKSPHRFPGLVLWGDPKGDDGAGIDLEPGIKVSIESTVPDLDKNSLENLPEYIRAAIVLNLTLASNVSPPENTGRLVGTDKGASTIVRISVGRKPLP